MGLNFLCTVFNKYFVIWSWAAWSLSRKLCFHSVFSEEQWPLLLFRCVLSLCSSWVCKPFLSLSSLFYCYHSLPHVRLNTLTQAGRWDYQQGAGAWLHFRAVSAVEGGGDDAKVGTGEGWSVIQGGNIVEGWTEGWMYGWCHLDVFMLFITQCFS